MTRFNQIAIFAIAIVVAAGCITALTKAQITQKNSTGAQPPTSPKAKAVPPIAPSGLTPKQQQALHDEIFNDPNKRYTAEPYPLSKKDKPRTKVKEKAVQTASAFVKQWRPVPQDRLNYFSWLNQKDCPIVFFGWACFVTDVVPTPTGSIIKIQVSPRVTVGKAGSWGSVFNCFIEEYFWSDGKLNYIKGYRDPKSPLTPSYGW